MRLLRDLGTAVLLGAVTWAAVAAGAETFRVGTYNLEGYLDRSTDTRPAKSAASKARIREGLRLLQADILALQEIGGSRELLELRESLKQAGLYYPYWEHVAGHDTNIHLAVLSRFSIVARRPHTNETFLLFGRRLGVSRGFAEVDIQVNPAYKLTLITAHLKSKRLSAEAAEAEWREQEAIRLREYVNARFKDNAELNLVVLGDFNDTRDSRPIRGLMGRGRTALIDTRPAERNGDDPMPLPGHSDSRSITWTHYFAREDTYSRIDYILISRGMGREWNRSGTYVLTLPNWGVASDHRPIVAEFVAEDGR